MEKLKRLSLAIQAVAGAGLLLALLVTCGGNSSIPAGFQTSPAVAFPLRLSSNNKYLEDQLGIPYLIVADAGWELTTQISQEEAIDYLEDRLDKGFNAVEIRVIGRSFQTNAPNNFYNDPPFTNGPGDWSARNEAYWTRVDFILTEMKNRGMVAILFPAYLGFDCGSQGWCQEMIAQTDAAMTNYGQWIGNRYKDYDNILWMTGGDADASLYTNALSRTAAIVNAIRSVDNDALFSVEPAPNQLGGVDSYASLVDINGMYTYGSPETMAQQAYLSNRPFMFQEGFYENEHGTALVDQEAQAFITYLGGGLAGHVFGSCPLWSFGTALGFCDSSSTPFNTWQNNLNSPGSIAQGNIGHLMRSRAWWAFVPDYGNSVVTSPKGSEMNYHATAREESGKTVMVWSPDTIQITVNMTKISGTQAKAWWYNPDDNSADLIGTYATTGSKNFIPQNPRTVLVLDDASLNLPSPGTTP